jgi:hypothetical protein
VKRGDDGALAVGDEALQCIANAEAGERGGLAGKREGLDEHEAAEECADAGDERAGAELTEAVDGAVAADDVVGGLGAAVVADDQLERVATDEGVDSGALALVAVAEAGHDDRSLAPR